MEVYGVHSFFVWNDPLCTFYVRLWPCESLVSIYFLRHPPTSYGVYQLPLLGLHPWITYNFNTEFCISVHLDAVDNTSVTLELFDIKKTSTKVGELFVVLSGMIVSQANLSGNDNSISVTSGECFWQIVLLL